MNPKHFVALCVSAAASLLVAILTYSSYVPWTEPAAFAKLFSNLATDSNKVAAIEVTQGNSKVNLERKGTAWGLKERDGYPVNADKVRTLLISLQDAELAEDKTRRQDRYPQLQLEDPNGKDANSQFLKLLDDNRATISELVVGKVRPNAFGGGKGGTYIRKPGDPQTWLVNAEISTPASIKDWVKPRIFEAQAKKVRKISIEVAGEQPLNIDWDAAAARLKLSDIPAGKRMKYANSLEDIAESLGKIDMDDVRKILDMPAGANVSAVKAEIEGGLKVTYTFRKTAEGDWLSMSATGEGEQAKFAELFANGVKDWEFKLPRSKAGEILKKRSDLLEDIVEPVPGPGSSPKPPAGDAASKPGTP